MEELQSISESDFESQQVFRALSMQAEIKLSAGHAEEALAMANQVLEKDGHF